MDTSKKTVEVPRDKLYQLGVPLHRLSYIFMLWDCFDPKRPILIQPSKKSDDIVIVELSHTLLVAQIVKDLPEIKINEVSNKPKTITL